MNFGGKVRQGGGEEGKERWKGRGEGTVSGPTYKKASPYVGSTVS